MTASTTERPTGDTPFAPINGTRGHAPDMHWPSMVPALTSQQPTLEPQPADDRRTRRALAKIRVAEAKAAAKEAAAQRREQARRTAKAAKQVNRSTNWAKRWTALEELGAKLRTVFPLLIVNGAAVYGQVRFAYDDIAPNTWNTAGKIGLAAVFAAAVETVAIYVGWHAHDALLNKSYRTARDLRLASYGIAAVVGSLNYAHFAGDHMAPTAGAVAFGLLSLLSPWLWGLHTRRVHHLQLLAEHEVVIDRAGVEFDPARKRAFPWRTRGARRWSIEHNVSDPIEAWDGYHAALAAKKAEKVAEVKRREVARFAREIASSAADKGDAGAALSALRSYVESVVGPTTLSVPEPVSTDRVVGPDGAKNTDRQSARRRRTHRQDCRSQRRLVRRPTARQVVDVPVGAPVGPGSTDNPTAEPTDLSTDNPTALSVEKSTNAQVSPLVGSTTDRPVRRSRGAVHTPAAVANAAILRERYGDRLTDSDSQIRQALGWSYDRLKPAKAAYKARADKKADTPTAEPTTEPTDNPEIGALS